MYQTEDGITKHRNNFWWRYRMTFYDHSYTIAKACPYINEHNTFLGRNYKSWASSSI